jgi:hypothetical protein
MARRNCELPLRQLTEAGLPTMPNSPPESMILCVLK